MESTKAQIAENIRMRFQQYKERHQDAMQRYRNNVPVQQMRDRELSEILVQNSKVQQPQKSKTTKQLDNVRRYSNHSNDPTSNASLNGAFNNNDIPQIAQKRPYPNVNGNQDGDDSVHKMSRINDGNKQFSNVPNNVSINPNVNPFKYAPNNSLPTASAKSAAIAAVIGGSGAALSLSNTLLANMQSSNNPMSDRSASSDLSSVKNEPSVVSSCNVTSTNTPYGNPVNSRLNNFGDFNDPLAGLAGFKLYGETTKKNNLDSNTPKTNIKVEKQASKDNDTKVSIAMQNNQNNPQNWSTSLSEQNINSLTNTINHIKSQNPLEHLGSMVPRQPTPTQQNTSNQQQQLHIQQKHNMVQQQAQQPHQQTNQQRSLSGNTINNTSMVLGKSKVARPNSVSSPHSIIQSPECSLHSPLNSLQQQSSMSSISPSSINTLQNNIPPNLPRLPTMPNMRQHLADHINKHQQPTMTNVNNPFITSPAGPTTKEKLQEHLLKNREQQSRLQLQSQMVKNQYISQQHMISPVNNPMSQINPSFQFPNDFQNYNQQNMSMQPQQSPMGFYPNQYHMDQSPAGSMFSSAAPPVYNQQNRAAGMLRGMIRDHQPQMSEMYSTIGGRTSMEQHSLFNATAKAPPQYPNQGISIEQQMMLDTNVQMQNASRLSHFSQSSNGSMGRYDYATGMSMGQIRMNRFPAPPTLSRSMNMNDNMNPVDNSQFNAFNMVQNSQNLMSASHNQPNQGFNSNFSASEHMLLQKRRLAHRQQLLNMQRQSQLMQQQQQQAQSYNIMNNSQSNMMSNDPSMTNSMSNIMNLNSTTNMYPQQHQQQSRNRNFSPQQQHHANMSRSISNDPTQVSSGIGLQSSHLNQNALVQSSNNSQSNRLSDSTFTENCVSSIVQSSANMRNKSNNINNAITGSILNTQSPISNTPVVNLSTTLSEGNDDRGDNIEHIDSNNDDSDLDNLLNNPPEHFNLLDMFNS